MLVHSTTENHQLGCHLVKCLSGQDDLPDYTHTVEELMRSPLEVAVVTGMLAEEMYTACGPALVPPDNNKDHQSHSSSYTSWSTSGRNYILYGMDL